MPQVNQSRDCANDNLPTAHVYLRPVAEPEAGSHVEAIVHTPQRCIMPLQTQHRLVPFPRLHRMHTQAAVRFINYDGECVIEAGGKRLSGKIGGNFTVPTSVELGDEPAAIEVALVKERGGPSRLTRDVGSKNQAELRHYASFGAIRPGADMNQILGYQQGGVCLSTWGRLWVDNSREREGLGEINEGARVRVEWQPSVPQIAWAVDGQLVAELRGDYRTYAFAVGGKNDHHKFELQQRASCRHQANEAPS